MGWSHASCQDHRVRSPLGTHRLEQSEPLKPAGKLRARRPDRGLKPGPDPGRPVPAGHGPQPGSNQPAGPRAETDQPGLAFGSGVPTGRAAGRIPGEPARTAKAGRPYASCGGQPRPPLGVHSDQRDLCGAGPLVRGTPQDFGVCPGGALRMACFGSRPRGFPSAGGSIALLFETLAPSSSLSLTLSSSLTLMAMFRSLSLCAVLACAAGVLSAQQRTVTLADALRLSERVQPDVVRASAAIRTAGAQRRNAWGSFLPNVTANSSANEFYTEGAPRLDPVTGQITGGNSTNRRGSTRLSASVDLLTRVWRQAELRGARARVGPPGT